MGWNLFIDDERWPMDATWADWCRDNRIYFVTRTIAETVEYIDNFGFPQFISFDHDLAGDERAIDIVKLIIEKDLDGIWEIPEGFKFAVHSKNPIGAENISVTFNNYLEFKSNV